MSVRTGSIGSAIIWMFILSLLLFWLPLIGPCIAGFVGGRKAGSVSNAVLASLLPALAVGAALFFFGSLLTGMPLLGMIAGAGGVAVALAHVLPMLIAAIVGAAV